MHSLNLQATDKKDLRSRVLETASVVLHCVRQLPSALVRRRLGSMAYLAGEVIRLSPGIHSTLLAISRIKGFGWLDVTCWAWSNMRHTASADASSLDFLRHFVSDNQEGFRATRHGWLSWQNTPRTAGVRKVCRSGARKVFQDRYQSDQCCESNSFLPITLWTAATYMASKQPWHCSTKPTLAVVDLVVMSSRCQRAVCMANEAVKPKMHITRHVLR